MSDREEKDLQGTVFENNTFSKPVSMKIPNSKKTVTFIPNVKDIGSWDDVLGWVLDLNKPDAVGKAVWDQLVNRFKNQIGRALVVEMIKNEVGIPEMQEELQRAFLEYRFPTPKSRKTKEETPEDTFASFSKLSKEQQKEVLARIQLQG